MDENQNLEKEGQEAAQQVLPAEKKPNRKPLMVLALVLLVALAGIGAYAWNNNRVAEKETPAVETKKVAVVQIQPEEVTGKIKSDLSQDYTVLDLDKNNQPATGQVGVRVEKTSPVYKPSGYNFYTNYNGGSNLYVISASSASSSAATKVDKKIRQQIIDTYLALGLTKTQTTGSLSDGTASEQYEGKGLICVASPVDDSTSGSMASCGLLAEYPKAAAKTKPLADAIGKLDEGTILANVKITNSLVSGYQRAELGQGSVDGGGGSMALLYKKDGGSWKYFKNVQEAPSCSDYNTVDLRNAFKGEKCYDQATNSSDALVK